MTLGVHNYNPVSSVDFRQVDPGDKHLKDHLFSEDWAFLNFRGAHGAPHFPEDYVETLVAGLYSGYSNSEQGKPSYYSSEMNETVKKNDESIRNMRNKIYKESPPKEEIYIFNKAISELKYENNKLQNPCQDQMLKLFNEAKLIFKQRKVENDPTVKKTIAIIDNFLQNIGKLESSNIKTACDIFPELYAKEVKKEIEFLIAKARNPFPIKNEFFSEARKMDSLKTRFDKAIEVVRPQVISMAEILGGKLESFAVKLENAQNAL